jgi:hypothetical protein
MRNEGRIFIGKPEGGEMEVQAWVEEKYWNRSKINWM